MFYPNYISGDYDSPNAPWNDRFEACPSCKGTGFRYFAENIHTSAEVEVNAETYYALPESREVAERLHGNFCRAYDGMQICGGCCGDGERRVGHMNPHRI